MILHVGVKGQDTTVTTLEDGYIERYSGFLNLRLSVSNDIETFSVETGANDLTIVPNVATATKLNFNYKLISFAISYAPKFFSANDDLLEKGKTRHLGFGLNFTIKKLFYQMSYSRTKGYFLENTSDYNPTWRSGDAYIQFPGFTVNSFEGVLGYKFNSKFSQIAHVNQSERQLKSAGSFLPQLQYRYYAMHDSKNPNNQSSKNYLATLGLGYQYTLVVTHRLYMTAGLVPCAGIIHTDLKTPMPSGDVLTNSDNFLVQLKGQFGVGYNGRRFYTGLFINSSSFVNRQAHTTAMYFNDKNYVEGFIGYRFNAPGILKRGYDMIYNLAVRQQKALFGKSFI